MRCFVNLFCKDQRSIFADFAWAEVGRAVEQINSQHVRRRRRHLLHSGHEIPRNGDEARDFSGNNGTDSWASKLDSFTAFRSSERRSTARDKTVTE